MFIVCDACGLDDEWADFMEYDNWVTFCCRSTWTTAEEVAEFKYEIGDDYSVHNPDGYCYDEDD